MTIDTNPIVNIHNERMYFTTDHPDVDISDYNYMFQGAANWAEDFVSNLTLTLEWMADMTGVMRQEVNIFTTKWCHTFYLSNKDREEKIRFIQNGKWQPKDEKIVGFVVTIYFNGMTPMKYVVPMWMDLNWEVTKDVTLKMNPQAEWYRTLEQSQP